MLKMSRRLFVPMGGAGLAAAYTALRARTPERLVSPPGTSVVAIAKVSGYRCDLVRPILDGVRACGLNVRGKNVLLKPNLVEFDASTTINTDPAVVAAAYAAFHQLGAATVLVGEGPGHRRDTYNLARQAGYYAVASNFEQVFTDLNRDDVTGVPGFLGSETLYLPDTALRADIIVSLAKMKTHHWAGVTLSMKNLFGIVPGAVYGWPKNRLHYAGITTSILELNRMVRNTFAIVDGVIGMEGNGPIQGRPKPCGVLVMGRDLRAVDATCCRVMGIEPLQVEYLRMAGALGQIEEGRIEQRGEPVAAVATGFDVIGRFSHLKKNAKNFKDRG